MVAPNAKSLVEVTGQRVVAVLGGNVYGLAGKVVWVGGVRGVLSAVVGVFDGVDLVVWSPVEEGVAKDVVMKAAVDGVVRVDDVVVDDVNVLWVSVDRVPAASGVAPVVSERRNAMLTKGLIGMLAAATLIASALIGTANGQSAIGLHEQAIAPHSIHAELATPATAIRLNSAIAEHIAIAHGIAAHEIGDELGSAIHRSIHGIHQHLALIHAIEI